MTYLSFFCSWVISEQSIFRVVLSIWTCTAHSWMGTYCSSWTVSELFALALTSIVHCSFFSSFFFIFLCGGRWLKKHNFTSVASLQWLWKGRNEPSETAGWLCQSQIHHPSQMFHFIFQTDDNVCGKPRIWQGSIVVSRKMWFCYFLNRSRRANSQ